VRGGVRSVGSRLGVHFALLLPLAIACSSAAPLPVVKDAGSGGVDASQSALDGGAALDGAKACIKDLGRIAENDAAENCCTGLFKACVTITTPEYGTPCICSTVACGTAAMPPPRDVPCCPDVLSRECSTVAGSGFVTCTCK
jgi:hypothetical protein